MFISMTTIKELFSEYESTLVNSTSTHFLYGWERRREMFGPLDEGMLYVVNHISELEAIDPGELRLHVICPCDCGQDPDEYALELPEGLSALIVCCGSAELICSRLRTYFADMCSLGMFGNSMLEYFPLKGGLQAGIDHAYRVFGNPVFVIDANFNIVAATWAAIEELGVSDSFVRNRRLDDLNSGLASLELHEQMMRSPTPVRAFNKALGYEQLLCSIDQDTNAGHIVVSAVNRPLNDMDSEMMLVLKKFVALKLAQGMTSRGGRGLNHEYFLEGLLSGLIDRQHANAFLVKAAQLFEGPMRCVVVSMTRSDAPLGASHIQSAIEARFPGTRSIVHDGNVVAIISVPEDEATRSAHRSTLERLCREMSLAAGTSNAFDSIWQLPEHYRQALRAIELGSTASAATSHAGEADTGLRWYKDCAIRHLTSVFAEQESASAFCHPWMRTLIDHDREHRGELAYTLYMWLAHERNLSATADAMSMHRSSLIYRFKKIHALVGDDFSDPTDRLYLMLSWEMCGRQET